MDLVVDQVSGKVRSFDALTKLLQVVSVFDT